MVFWCWWLFLSLLFPCSIPPNSSYPASLAQVTKAKARLLLLNQFTSVALVAFQEKKKEQKSQMEEKAVDVLMSKFWSHVSM